MKIQLPTAKLIAGLFLLLIIAGSCKKTTDSSSIPRSQLIMGKWNINRMQLKLSYGGDFVKDTIIPQMPAPENFVQFTPVANFEYRFNSTTSDIGTYQFVSPDSLISNVTSKIYRWKILTMTNQLFTVVNTSSSPSFPGATVETYQTFVK